MKNFGIFLTVFALYFLGFDADAILTPVGGGAGSGTVTSVNIADDSTTPIFTPSGGPVTVSGVLAFTLKNQNAGSVLLGPASGGPAQPTFGPLTGSYLSAIQTLDNVVYLSGNGNDATCIQNSIFLPCQTLQQAMNISSVNPNVVNLIQATDCNVYSGDGLNWFPDVIFQGAGQFCTVIDFGNSGLTMDPSWANGGNFVGGIIATQLISSGTVPALTFDFSGISVGGNDLFLLQDVYANTNIDSNFLAINTGNQQGFLLQNYTQNKGNFDFTDVNFAFLVNSVNQNSGLNITTTGANNCGVTMESSLLNGTVNITGNASGGYGALFVYGGFVNGTININNSNSYLLPTVGSVPPLSSIVSNGNIFFQSDVTSIPYSAANPGQWTGFGVTYPNPALAGQNQISVQNALDGIANYVSTLNLSAPSVTYTPTNPSQWYFQLGGLPSTVQQALDFIAQSGVLNVNSDNVIYVNNQGNDATCIQGLVTSPCASLGGAETYLVNNGTQNNAVIFIDGAGEYSFVGVNITANLTVIGYNSNLVSIDFGNGPTFDPVTWATGGFLNLINVGLRSSTAPPTVTFDVGTASIGASGALFMDGVLSEMFVANVDFTGTANPNNVNFTVQNSFSADPWEFDDSNFTMSNTEVDGLTVLNYTTAMSTNPLINTSAFPVGFTMQSTGTGSLFPIITASHIGALDTGFTLSGANVAMTVSMGVLPASSAVHISGGASVGVDGDGEYIPYTPASTPNWTGLTGGTAPSNIAQVGDLLAGALEGGTGNLTVNNVNVANYFTIPVAPLGGPGLVGAPGGSLELTSTGILCSFISGNWVSASAGAPTPCPF